MRVKGSAFPPRSSARQNAELDFTQANFLTLEVENESTRSDLQWVEISVPVGNLPIRFKFPDGWVFVVDRTPQINQWLKANKKSGLVDKFEANIFAWLISAIFCIGLVVGSYVYALPWASQKVASLLPDYVAVTLGDKVLESFDEHWQKSELSQQQQQQIKHRLKQNFNQLAPLPYPIEVVFRTSDMGANAFALPGGKVVILDQMVELAKDTQQLDSIILHEVGHIYHKHMLEKLVHSSLLSVAVSLLTGESSGIIDNLAGIGVFILSNGHSQEAELEADEYAKQSMRTIYGTSEPMAEMFELFSEQGDIEIPQWLSSHPDFKQRIEAARKE